jgi:hypothetical protein
MNATDLLRFVIEKELEYRWYNDDVILFVETFNIQEFNKLFSPTSFDDGGIECYMKDGYFCFEMQEILDPYGIELTDIFRSKK